MPYRAQFEQWIPVPLDEVFRFFADPGNLPRIMPPWMGVRIEDATIVPVPDSPHSDFAGPGSTLVASYRTVPFLPFRIRSQARIVGFAMNDFFEDVQDQGPFRSWHHRHEFASETRNGTSGTRLRDQIEYEIGFEPLGWILNVLFIAPQMRRTFAYRRRAVERLFATAT
jgi:ligand-binding SRPBCC domain-containing protein